MTDDDRTRRDRVRRDRIAQGLPATVTDRTALRVLAAVLTNAAHRNA